MVIFTLPHLSDFCAAHQVEAEIDGDNMTATIRTTDGDWIADVILV